MNGSSYVKSPLRSNAKLNIQNVDEKCFIWSIIAYHQPCNNSHPTRVINYSQNFNKLNLEEFDFTNGLKCSDIHRFEKINKLSMNMFELNFYQGQDKWKHNLIPIEISKNISDSIFDLLLYKNLYALIK